MNPYQGYSDYQDYGMPPAAPPPPYYAVPPPHAAWRPPPQYYPPPYHAPSGRPPTSVPPAASSGKKAKKEKSEKGVKAPPKAAPKPAPKPAPKAAPKAASKTAPKAAPKATPAKAAANPTAKTAAAPKSQHPQPPAPATSRPPLPPPNHPPPPYPTEGTVQWTIMKLVYEGFREQKERMKLGEKEILDRANMLHDFREITRAIVTAERELAVKREEEEHLRQRSADLEAQQRKLQKLAAVQKLSANAPTTDRERDVVAQQQELKITALKRRLAEFQENMETIHRLEGQTRLVHAKKESRFRKVLLHQLRDAELPTKSAARKAAAQAERKAAAAAATPPSAMPSPSAQGSADSGGLFELLPPAMSPGGYNDMMMYPPPDVMYEYEFEMGMGQEMAGGMPGGAAPPGWHGGLSHPGDLEGSHRQPRAAPSRPPPAYSMEHTDSLIDSAFSHPSMMPSPSLDPSAAPYEPIGGSSNPFTASHHHGGVLSRSASHHGGLHSEHHSDGHHDQHSAFGSSRTSIANCAGSATHFSHHHHGPGPSLSGGGAGNAGVGGPAGVGAPPSYHETCHDAFAASSQGHGGRRPLSGESTPQVSYFNTPSHRAAPGSLSPARGGAAAMVSSPASGVSPLHSATLPPPYPAQHSSSPGFGGASGAPSPGRNSDSSKTSGVAGSKSPAAKALSKALEKVSGSGGKGDKDSSSSSKDRPKDPSSKESEKEKEKAAKALKGLKAQPMFYPNAAPSSSLKPRSISAASAVPQSSLPPIPMSPAQRFITAASDTILSGAGSPVPGPGGQGYSLAASVTATLSGINSAAQTDDDEAEAESLLRSCVAGVDLDSMVGSVNELEGCAASSVSLSHSDGEDAASKYLMKAVSLARKRASSRPTPHTPRSAAGADCAMLEKVSRMSSPASLAAKPIPDFDSVDLSRTENDRTDAGRSDIDVDQIDLDRLSIIDKMDFTAAGAGNHTDTASSTNAAHAVYDAVLSNHAGVASVDLLMRSDADGALSQTHTHTPPLRPIGPSSVRHGTATTASCSSGGDHRSGFPTEPIAPRARSRGGAVKRGGGSGPAPANHSSHQDPHLVAVSPAPGPKKSRVAAPKRSSYEKNIRCSKHDDDDDDDECDDIEMADAQTHLMRRPDRSGRLASDAPAAATGGRGERGAKVGGCDDDDDGSLSSSMRSDAADGAPSLCGDAHDEDDGLHGDDDDVSVPTPVPQSTLFPPTTRVGGEGVVDGATAIRPITTRTSSQRETVPRGVSARGEFLASTAAAQQALLERSPHLAASLGSTSPDVFSGISGAPALPQFRESPGIAMESRDTPVDGIVHSAEDACADQSPGGLGRLGMRGAELGGGGGPAMTAATRAMTASEIVSPSHASTDAMGGMHPRHRGVSAGGDSRDDLMSADLTELGSTDFGSADPMGASRGTTAQYRRSEFWPSPQHRGLSGAASRDGATAAGDGGSNAYPRSPASMSLSEASDFAGWWRGLPQSAFGGSDLDTVSLSRATTVVSEPFSGPEATRRARVARRWRQQNQSGVRRDGEPQEAAALKALRRMLASTAPTAEDMDEMWGAIRTLFHGA